MLDDFFYEKKLPRFNNNIKSTKKFQNQSNIRASILGVGGQLPSDLEALVISGILMFPQLIIKNFETLESFDIQNLRLKDIRDNVLTFVKKEYSDLDIDLLKEFIEKNYQTFFQKDLKFANKFWQKKEGVDFDIISKIWVEILKDDQHIKNLNRDISVSKKEIKNEDDERRFIGLIDNKDKAIKLITEKYGEKEIN